MLLEVVPKPPAAAPDSLATRTARKAAMARWHPRSNSTETDSTNGLSSEAARLMPSADEIRNWRRGESEVQVGSYRQYSAAEMLEWVDRMLLKEMKWTELQKLYDEGRTPVPPAQIKRYIYGASAQQKLAKLRATMEFEKLGAPHQGSSRKHGCRTGFEWETRGKGAPHGLLRGSTGAL